MNLKDIDWGYFVVTMACVVGVIVILTSCGIHPDIARQKQAQVIPPPGCEKVNTIVYGREAGCKE